ncbi:MAG: lysozyme [Mariprofundaceae bacterium]
MARNIIQPGIDLIKHFESLRLDAYQDSVGIWTIGYGHTGLEHKDGTVFAGREISEDEAELLLRRDLDAFEKAVENTVQVDLNDYQFAALVSFAFNLGGGNLRASTLLKKLNANDYFAAAGEFKKWSKAGGERLGGLVRRRISERNLFCTFPDPIVSALPDDWETIYPSL